MATDGHALDDLHAVGTGWHATRPYRFVPHALRLASRWDGKRYCTAVRTFGYIQCDIVSCTLTARSDEDEDQDGQEDEDGAQFRATL